MNIKARVKVLIGNFFSSKRFSKIVVEKAVVDDIIGFSRNAYPKEFIALLKGSIKGSVLFVDGLLYQVNYTSGDSALVKLDLPLLSGCVGSVHSHPSNSNLPSGADLNFFSKNGAVHFIICMPFKTENIACYSYGKRVTFEIK